MTSEPVVSGDVKADISGHRPFDDSHVRCRRCFGLLVYDIGPGIFGQQETGEHCPRCDSPGRWE